jgi:hypothetical protein
VWIVHKDSSRLENHPATVASRLCLDGYRMPTQRELKKAPTTMGIRDRCRMLSVYYDGWQKVFWVLVGDAAVPFKSFGDMQAYVESELPTLAVQHERAASEAIEAGKAP